MTGDFLLSWEVECLSWLEAETYAPVFGTKGSRLLSIPRMWTPSFLLLSVDATARMAEDGDPLTSQIWPEVEKLATETGCIILRSSVVGETIWDRGTHHSEPLSLGRAPDLDRQEFMEAVQRIVRSAEGRACAIIVQSFHQPDEEGEFGNLQRISKTRDHWELGVRAGELLQTDRYNSQRDTAPSTGELLTAKAGLSRERLFGSVSAWINNELLRGVRTRVNCEWLRSGETFFIVQVDAEDDDLHGINPMQLHVEPSIRTSTRSGKLLQAADATARATWDKLRVVDELFPDPNEAVPALYFVPVADFRQVDSEVRLRDDFANILTKNIVVRTSVLTGSEKLTNLPKTDCLTPEEAARWCLENSRTISKTHGDREFAFVAHRYIASRSSAWAKADPAKPTVEVHGTWGLPDALQFCPYDIWEVHVPTDEVTEYPSYKSNVLLLQEDGTWKYERVKNDIARFQSMSRGQVLEVAQRSLQLAQRLEKPCHIMWFVGCRTDENEPVNIPWYWTEAHQTEAHERGRLVTFDVRSKADLSRIKALKQRTPRLAVALKPESAELLRDNAFLAEVANATVPHGVPVLLSGSTLAHAYYQLRKHGCVVIPEGDKDHLRVRRQANFGKLVRDKIPDKIASQREQQAIATIPKSSRIGFLIGKFIEELLEAREAVDKGDLTTELADVFEVLRALVSIYDIDIESVTREADRKKQKVGGFEEGRLLIGTSLPKPSDNDLVRDEIVAPEVFGELTRGATYRIPFAFFGFCELGQGKSFYFPKDGITLQITLQRDAIEISVTPDAKQLDLDL
jgi:predicted house-cleaning noncanonical NTP pyrophosphatase (MazG superfamily)